MRASRRDALLTRLQAALQAEFGDDSLAEFGTRGMWEDVRACVARLVAVGPPAEEGAHPQDEVADEIVEVPPPAHEEVSTPVTS